MNQAVLAAHPHRYRLFCLSALLLAALSLSGCQSVAGNGTTSQIRIVNASSTSGGLDVYEGSTALIYNLGFASSTAYVPIAPGTYTFKATQDGTTTALLSTSATVAASKQYTFLLSEVDATLTGKIFTDQSSAAPTGYLTLRFLDQATAAGAVDIYAVPSTATLLTTTAIATNVEFGGNTGYLELPSGVSYTLYIVATGTTISDTTTALYTGTAVTYGASSAHTVVLFDQTLTTTSTVQVKTLEDYSSPTATS